MRSTGRAFVVLFSLMIITAACAPSAGVPRTSDASSQPQAAPRSPARTLVIAMHVEPTTLAPRPITTSGATPDSPPLLFSSWLVVADGHNVARPQLAEKLPELNTDDWQVFPDGTMRTTYHLRAGLTWQDGAPLTASDVVFGYKVFTWADLGVPRETPISLVQDVAAPDDRTVVINWKQPYGDAGALATGRYGGIPPMPRHLLETKFQAGDAQAFANDPYWTNEFVGSGPYKLDRWEPGAFILASAWDGFVEGKPKIEQLKIVTIADASTASASLRAGEINVAAQEAIGFAEGAFLKKSWESTGAGKVLLTPNKSRFLQVQFKPDYNTQRALLDLRVRRAILQATDREALSGAILDGEPAVAHALTGPSEEYFADLDRVVTKYPYNLQEAERLLTDAGFTKRTDGFAPGYFVDASGQRLSFELRAFAADPGPTEAAILASQWKNFGIDAPIYVIPAAQSQSLEQVSAYPGVRIEQTGLNGTTPIGKLQSQFVATAENRWSGVNRGGWVNADFDRLANVYVAALDRAQRNQAAVQAFKVASDELGDIPLYYLSLASAYTSDLEGMVGGYNGDTAWDNVFQWRWVR